MNIEEVLKKFPYRELFSFKTLYRNSKGDQISVYKPNCGLVYFTCKSYHPRFGEYVLHRMDGPALIYFNGDVEWHILGQKCHSEEDYWMRRLFYGKKKKKG